MFSKQFLLFVLLAVLPTSALSAPPSITLVSPVNLNLSHTNNITFFCNLTDDENVYRVSFYNNINGAFAPNQTKGIMELDKTENTTMLCHFDNSYTCVDGENGVNDSTTFEPSIFMQSVQVSSSASATLYYPITSKLSYDSGTIEFWIKLGFNPGDDNFWLLDTSVVSAGHNKIELKIGENMCTPEQIDNGDCYTLPPSSNLTFHLIGDSGEYIAWTNISAWNSGEWHHIAITWKDANSNGVTNIYIDGSNESLQHSDYGTTGSLDQYLFIGSDASGSGQSDSTFDELRLSSTALTPEEINASYAKGVANHSVALADFSLENTPDGIYSWNCLAYDNASNVATASSNSTIKIDVSTPPAVNSVTYSPNSTDDVDPGVMLNFTANVTDMTNVSTVLLEYKYEVDWTNVTMTRNGDLWNASITTYGGGNRYYNYRFHVNDTRGISDTTAISTINITFDYTWTRSPVNDSAYGLVNMSSQAVIISINNTGDDALLIGMSDDWTRSVSYNTTKNFSVAAKSMRKVNVTATFAEVDSVRDMIITIVATPAAGGTASPQSNTTTVTMNSYTAGSYIVLDMTSYPLLINQSSTANITASFSNIGNETAHNITLNWSLPEGWTNVSGAVNSFINNITRSNGTIQKTITVSLGSSAASGISRVYFSVTKNWNETYSDYADIQVACSNSDGVCGVGCTFNNDVDCPAQQIINGGSPLGSSSSIETATPRYGIRVNVVNLTDVYPGDNVTLLATVVNTERSTIVNNITLKVSGYPLALVKITPARAGNLTFGSGTQFMIKLSVPDYMKYGRYDITLEATGYSKRTDTHETRISSSALTVLFVHNIVENEAKRLIAVAESSLNDLQSMGVYDKQLSDSLALAKKSLEESDYDTVKTISESIINAKETALRTKQMLVDLSGKMAEAEKYGVTVTETKKMYTLAALAFDRGDYKRSEERVVTGMAVYDAEAGNKMLQAKIISDYGPYSPFVIILLLVGGFFALKFLNKRRIRKILEGLEKEEKAIRSLMKSVQEKFFAENKMSKGEYEENYAGYENRLAEIKKEKSYMRGKLKKGGERAHIIEEIKDAQKKRFEKGELSRNLYEKSVNELNQELAEMEKNRPSKKRFFAVIMFVFLLSGTVLADENMTRAMNAIEISQKVIDEMKQLDLPIKRANDTLTEAKLLFDQGSYMNAISMANYVATLKDMAVEDYNLVDSVEKKIQDAKLLSIDVSEEEAQFRNALALFNSEMFEDAKTMLTAILNSIDEKETQQTVSNTLTISGGSILLFVQNNKTALAATAITVLLITVVAYKASEKYRKKRKMSHLKNEKSRLEEVTRDLQRKYFEKGEITKIDYRARLKKYQSELAILNKNIRLLES